MEPVLIIKKRYSPNTKVYVSSTNDPREGVEDHGTQTGKGGMERDNRPWVDKHRPPSLRDVKGHLDILRLLNRYGADDDSIECMPHLLLHGPPGTGKTSTILALARDAYGNRFGTMVLELNASDDRGIDVVNNTILPFVGTNSLAGEGVKLVILDEADAMTIDAQSALRRIIERYTPTVRFCICCNYVSKIIPAVQSRCTRFRFSGMDRQSLEDKILDIIDKERIDIDRDAIDALLDMSGGDTRRVINLLQSSTMSPSRSDSSITREDVYNCAGTPTPGDVASITSVLAKGTFTEAHRYVENIIREKGYSLADIVLHVGEAIQHDEYAEDPRIPGIVEELTNVEHRLSHGGSDTLNIGAVVYPFHTS